MGSEAPNSTPPPGAKPLWGSHSGAGKASSRRPPSGGADGDDLSRRLLRLAGVLSVLLLAVVANALLHGGENSLNPIAQAAEHTRQMAGARQRVEAIYTVPGVGTRIVATGSGLYNARTGRSRARLTMPLPIGETARIVAVADPTTTFIRSNQETLPGDKRWVAMQPLLGQSEQTALASGAPDQSLAVLRSVSDDVESLGSAKAEGTTLEGYRGTVTFAGAAETFREEGKGTIAQIYERMAKVDPEPIHAEVWVDDNDLVRRSRTVMRIPVGAGVAMKMDLRIDFHDFGVEPRIGLPPASQVFDTTPILRAQLHLLNGSSYANLIRPSGGKPLSKAAFHSTGVRLCRQMMGQMRAVAQRARPYLGDMKRLQNAEPGSMSPEEVVDLTRPVALALYEPIVRDAESFLGRIGNLTPPPELRERFQRYLRLSAVQVETYLAETRMMEIGAFSSLHSGSDRTKQLGHEAKRLAHELGLGACESDSGAGSAGEVAS
jgi:hypothetical protein